VKKWQVSLHALRRRCAGIAKGFSQSLGIKMVATMSFSGIFASYRTLALMKGADRSIPRKKII